MGLYKFCYPLDTFCKLLFVIYFDIPKKTTHYLLLWAHTQFSNFQTLKVNFFWVPQLYFLYIPTASVFHYIFAMITYFFAPLYKKLGLKICLSCIDPHTSKKLPHMSNIPTKHTDSIISSSTQNSQTAALLHPNKTYRQHLSCIPTKYTDSSSPAPA